MSSSSSEDEYEYSYSYSENDKPDISHLPKVSIITPTYNRHSFLGLGGFCFLNFDYPPSLLEWIIIDDSDEPIEESILPDDIRIKYYYFNKKQIQDLYSSYHSKQQKKLSKKKWNKNPHLQNGSFIGRRLPLGLKRNLGCTYATGSVLIMTDDDDYYPGESVRLRVEYLLEHDKVECLGCEEINMFHNNKMTSIKNKSSELMKQNARIFENTLCFRRSFWERCRFDNADMEKEGKSFLKNRSCECAIINSDGIIVSILHKSNQDKLKGWETWAPNGWHFAKIPDELFMLICSINNNS